MFGTYQNTHNPHVTIHREGCNQLRKHGGDHKYNQGEYKNHETMLDAISYANTTGLPVNDCSFCKPSVAKS